MKKQLSEQSYSDINKTFRTPEKVILVKHESEELV